MRGLLIWQVEQLGYSAISAEGGREGVEKAVQEKPHLILMDIMMPGMDGWEATRTLRSRPEMRDVPILATTALFRESDLRACIEAGCNDYIVKPFTFQELQKKIERFFPTLSATAH